MSPARHPLAWRARAALGCLVLLAGAAVIGPALSPWPVDALDWGHIGVPPGAAGHLLGTDRLGRDLLVRTLAGLRVSLAVGLAATLVSLAIGVSWGALAGLAGGRTARVMMHLVDVFYSLPYVFFVILLTVTVGRSTATLFLAIGAVGWLTMARVVFAEAEGLARREFVVAARVAGVPPLRVLARHVVPNLAGTVLVYATLAVPGLILLESFLSFLGLGVQEPAASLGNLMAQGAAEMESAPWMLVEPCAVLVLVVLALGALGEGLREWLDPRAR